MSLPCADSAERARDNDVSRAGRDAKLRAEREIEETE